MEFFVTFLGISDNACKIFQGTFFGENTHLKEQLHQNSAVFQFCPLFGKNKSKFPGLRG